VTPAGGLSVELIGMPGSGKSTLSRRVAARLQAAGITVAQPSHDLAHGIARWRRLAGKSRHVARELIGHPADALRAVCAVRSTRQRRTGDVFKMTFNWLLVSRLLRRRPAAREVHLHDQGVLQALWSIGFGGAPGAAGRMARRMEGRVPLPDVVVIVRASEGTVARRLAGRTDRDSRLDAASGDRAALRLAADLLAEVLGVLEGWRRRPGGPRVIELDNETDESLETAAAGLAADVQKLFTPS